VARRPLERERISLDGGRRTTQLMRHSLGSGSEFLTMRPQSLAAALVLLIPLAALGLATPSRRDRSCHENPQLVGRCFSVHGLMSYSNGSILVKIEDTRTHAVFGVSTERFAQRGYCNLPKFLVDSLDADRKIEADFALCPFTRPKAEPIQMVCVDSARNIHTSAAHFLNR
jgi:hypothetical protein